MKKYELKEIIRNLVAKKLNEGDVIQFPGTKPEKKSKQQYGIVIGDENGEPKIQVVGHGTTKLSLLKKSATDKLESLAKEAKSGNFGNVEYGLRDDGVLMLFIKALKEVEEQLKSKKPVKEVGGIGGLEQPTSTNLPKDKAPAEQAPQMTDADAKALADANQNKEKLTNDISRIKGAVAKLQEPVKRKMMEAEKKIGDLEKKLGLASKKIEDINKKYKV